MTEILTPLRCGPKTVGFACGVEKLPQLLHRAVAWNMCGPKQEFSRFERRSKYGAGAVERICMRNSGYVGMWIKASTEELLRQRYYQNSEQRDGCENGDMVKLNREGAVRFYENPSAYMSGIWRNLSRAEMISSSGECIQLAVD